MCIIHKYMKYFIVSDVHSFYEELIEALKKAGYDKRNKDHTIVFLGDLFDRGSETIKLYDFIMSIPKERRILIKGNHEELYQELLYALMPGYRDFHNGTFDTFVQIAKAMDPSLSDSSGWIYIAKTVRESPITDFIYSDEWKDYLELDGYILTHGYLPIEDDHIKKDWRNASEKEWHSARWDYPLNHKEEMNNLSSILNGKALVVGHHGSRYYNDDKSYGIYSGDHLYVIDATTVLSHQVNVLVVEE